ncbi:MAG: hypothetical protein ACI9S8_000002 [Chlamydiales bacterium]|jgi:hypothetical protein
MKNCRKKYWKNIIFDTFVFICAFSGIYLLVHLLLNKFGDYPIIGEFQKIAEGSISIILTKILTNIYYFKKGPKVHFCKDVEQINKFLGEFLLNGSNAKVISKDASWMNKEFLKELNNKNVDIELFTHEAIDPKIEVIMAKSGITNHVTNFPTAKSRFTLLNSGKGVGQALAISRKLIPEHEITVYTSETGAQFLAMAEDIISLLKTVSLLKDEIALLKAKSGE